MGKILEKDDYTYTDKGSYTGPRGEQLVRGRDGKVYKSFICHGCQSCWQMDDNDVITDLGPHWLAPFEEHKETP